MGPDLKKFLIDNGVYQQFCHNLKNNNSGGVTDFKKFVKENKQNRTESDGGLFAFLWSDTPEGFYFWNSIDSLWQKYYKKCMQNG